MPSMTNPNILITGTPGVGKSTLCKLLATKLGFVWRDVSSIAKDNHCADEYDEDYKSSILDEDKLLDFMEPIMAEGGNIVDYHGCDLFPERWFSAVYVLRTDNTILYDRLVDRKYEGKKLDDNIQCEIFQTILEEAQISYKENIVFELQNNTDKDLEVNVERIEKWLQEWKKSHNKSLKRKHSESSS